jgi:catechol 2,3-dioxygenase-like lactoylglutathione lyase family enzyme
MNIAKATNMLDTPLLSMTTPLEVGIGCRDLAVMRQFYQHTLGLQFVSEARIPVHVAQTYRLARGSATVVRMQTSRGERIKLIAPDEAPALPAEYPTYVFDLPNVMYLTFIITDVKAAMTRLLETGVSFMTGPEAIHSRPGVTVAFLRDPEGNIIELVQYDDVPAYRPDLQ